MENKRLSREMRKLEFGQPGRKVVVEENIATDEFSTVGEGSRKQKEEWWNQEAVKEVLEKCGKNIITKRKASDMLGVPYNYVCLKVRKIENDNEINEKKSKRWQHWTSSEKAECKHARLVIGNGLLGTYIK